MYIFGDKTQHKKRVNWLIYCRKRYTIIATMKTDLRNIILKRIKDKKLKAFSCYDFTDLSSYKTISKCLERLEDSKVIARIIQGIYCLNLFDKVLSLPMLPSIDDVVRCLARKNKWIICPSGNTALNIMGLSTQVPSSYTYLNSGPYKNYLIYDTPVSLKRTMTRELIDYSYKTLLLIQCIKTLGKDTISSHDINVLKDKLSPIDKINALKETPIVQTWIRKIIVLVCKE